MELHQEFARLRNEAASLGNQRVEECTAFIFKGLISPVSGFQTKTLHTFLTAFACYIAALTRIKIRLIQSCYFRTVWPHVAYLLVTHPDLK